MAAEITAAVMTTKITTAMMATEITAAVMTAVMTTAVMVVEAPITLMPAAMGASVMAAARVPNMVVLLVLLPLLVPACFFYLSTLSCTFAFDVCHLIIFLLAEDETDECPATVPV